MKGEPVIVIIKNVVFTFELKNSLEKLSFGCL